MPKRDWRAPPTRPDRIGPAFNPGGSERAHIETTMSARTWVMLAGLSVVWGCSFLFVKIAVTGVTPVTLVFLRVSIAAFVLGLAMLATGERLPCDKKIWGAFCLMGLLSNVIPMSAFFWAQQFVPSGLGAILNATTPLFAALIGHASLPDERLSLHKLIGVMTGFVGVAALIGPDLLVQNRDAILPQLAFIFAAFCYAASSVYARHFSAFGLTPLQTACGQLAASTILLTPLSLLERPWLLPPPHWSVVFAVLGLALFSTAFALLLFFRILARAGATNVALVTLLVPITAVVIGSLVLHERLEPYRLIGMAIVALGLIIMDGRAQQKIKRLVG